jgi:hypothetical protein
MTVSPEGIFRINRKLELYNIDGTDIQEQVLNWLDLIRKERS